MLGKRKLIQCSSPAGTLLLACDLLEPQEEERSSESMSSSPESLENSQSSTSSDLSGLLLTLEHATRLWHHPLQPGHQDTMDGRSPTTASLVQGPSTPHLPTPNCGARLTPLEGNSKCGPEQRPPNHPLSPSGTDCPASTPRSCTMSCMGSTGKQFLPAVGSC